MAQSIRKTMKVFSAALLMSVGLAAAGSALVYAQTFMFSRFGTAQFGSSVFGGVVIDGETPPVPVPFIQTWTLLAMAVALIVAVYVLKYHHKESRL